MTAGRYSFNRSPLPCFLSDAKDAVIFKLRHQKTQQAIPVPPGVHVIGRDDQADLRFEDISISRRHARLTNENNLILVEDLGSSNGTTIRGQKISAPVELKFGDVVDFGNASFRIEPEVVGEISSSPPPALKRGLQPVAVQPSLNRQTAKLELPPASGEIPQPRARVVAAAPVPEEPPVSSSRASRRIELPPAGESGPVFNPKPPSSTTPKSSVPGVAGPNLAPVPNRMEALLPKLSGPMPVPSKTHPPMPNPALAAATAAPASPAAQVQLPLAPQQAEEEEDPVPDQQNVRTEYINNPVPRAQGQGAAFPLAGGLPPERNPFAVAAQKSKEAAAAQQQLAPQAPADAGSAPALVNMVPGGQQKQGWLSERQQLPLWLVVGLAFGTGVSVGIVMGIIIVRLLVQNSNLT